MGVSAGGEVRGRCWGWGFEQIDLDFRSVIKLMWMRRANRAKGFECVVCVKYGGLLYWILFPEGIECSRSLFNLGGGGVAWGVGGQQTI